MTRILSFTASDFRGLAAPINVDFRDSRSRTQSILLLGDNGSGKSSVADAFEFCLRGKVSRRGNAGEKSRREARNLLTGGVPSVMVELDNGKTYRRGKARKGFSGVNLGRDRFVPGFALSPVVLSRDDIEVFWHLSPIDRMRFFFDYLRKTVNHPGYAALEVERAERKLEGLSAKLLLAQFRLAKVSSWPVDQIPVDNRQAFHAWLRRAYPRSQKLHSAATSDDRPGHRNRRTGDRTPRRVQEAIAALSEVINEVHQLQRHLTAMRAQADEVDGIPAVIARELPALLAEISAEVTADFRSMADLDHVREIFIRVRDSGHLLDIGCVLSSGTEAEPSQVLSEGALDLLAILMLLGVSRACAQRGQARFLVLDDVWQSVDTIHREAILDYLFSGRFKGWQLLITVNDRLWARLIEGRARLNQFALKTLELARWTAADGPQLRTGKLSTPQQLSRLLEEAPPEAIGSYTGRALEELVDELSQTMRTSTSRAPGDRYTLGDLWPGVYSVLRKASLSEESRQVATKVDQILLLRNLYAAHYQRWAESFSSKEINDFASLILSLWDVTHCSECGSPLSLLNLSNRTIGWPCGHANSDGSGD
jgi:hypothetical protein